MFESIDEWLGQARIPMKAYADLRRLIDELEAHAARLLGEAVVAYQWPEDLPPPDEFNTYRRQMIYNHGYGEDLTSELAVAGRTSDGAAHYLVIDVAILNDDLPECWQIVTSGHAPLWRARLVAQACIGLSHDQCQIVDRMVAPCLSTLGSQRLTRLITAAVKIADPDRVLATEKKNTTRWVHTGGDDVDPTSGWVSARIDRSDAIYLDATVDLLADHLDSLGEPGDKDQRRARALGMLANPAAVVQLIGVHTTRRMDPPLQTQAEIDALTQTAESLVPVFTPRTQVYVHLAADSLDDPHALARIEKIGPSLVSQVHAITQGSRVRLTPVVHLDSTTISSDAYEIPSRIREQVLLRNTHDVFPWSSIESRGCDLDHTVAYIPGQPSQTTPSNLAPLSRRAHRVKTHAPGWHLDQPTPGTFIWRTGAGQYVHVDHTGTRHIPEPAPT